MRGRICLLVLSLLAGIFSGAAAAKTKVVLWHSYRGAERTALEKVVAAFNSADADVSVETLPIPYDAFADKVTFAVPSGKGPDLFIFAQDRVGDWTSSGYLEPLDFWVDAALKSKFLSPTVEALTYDDALMGLPMSFKMVALFYNPKLVPKPPATTDEMVSIAQKLTGGGRFGLVYENTNFYHHATWMQGFGGRVFDSKGNPTLDSPENIASLEFASFLAQGAKIMPEEVSSTLVTSLFNKGKAAMIINGPWFMGELEKNTPVAVAVLPVISKVGKPATPFLTAEGILMSSKAKDKKAAFRVMSYLTSVEAGLTMALEGRQTSARREVYDDPRIQKDPILTVFRDQLKNTIPMPNTPAMRKIWSPATTAMNKVINGKVPPAEALKAAQVEVVEALKGTRR